MIFACGDFGRWIFDYLNAEDRKVYRKLVLIWRPSSAKKTDDNDDDAYT